MGQWRVRIQAKTRSQTFLWQMSLGILALGLAVAWALSLAHTPGEIGLDAFMPSAPNPLVQDPTLEGLDLTNADVEQPDPHEVIDPWLAEHAQDTALLLRSLPILTILALSDADYDLEAALGAAVDDPARRAIAVEALRSLLDGEPTEALREMAGRDPPVRFANLALAQAHLQAEDARQAAAAYEREGTLPEADEARRAAVQLYLDLDAFDELARLGRDPLYAHVMTATVNYRLAVRERDWLGVLRWVWPARFDLADPGYIALGVLSGVFWLLFLLHAGEVRSPLEARFGLCLAGVALGAVSVAPCLFVYEYMEIALGFTFGEEPDLRQGLLYCFVGIALNEELCKLLLFMPLAPVLVRRRRALEMVVVAACVGLGFAAEENIAYFQGSMGSAAPGRFLTANFLHMSATGLVGFAFCQLLLKPAERAADFAIVFIGVVTAHALYDALIMVPALTGWAYFSGTVFILLAYQFFRELQQYRRWTARTVSLTAVFLGGFALLIAAAFNYAAWHHGIGAAADAMVAGSLGVAIIIIMYLREINEALTP